MLTSILLSLVSVSAGHSSTREAAPPYRDPKQPLETRVHDLLSRLTLEEKAGMMSNSTPGVPHLGIPKYDWWSEALHGVANAGQATVFPQAIGLAAMWNEGLQQEIAHVIGIEGRAKFNGYLGTPLEGAVFRGLTFWSPNINIFRDPRWGRGQETYGEDPFLTSRLGTAFVRGLQGDHPDYLLAAACAKHYAVHSGPEPPRHRFDVAPSPRDLHETYLPAFEALVRDARVEIVMTAYNAICGEPCSVSPLLYGLLADWGFAAHVTSDCGSVDDLHRTYRRAQDAAEANAITLKAGMNLRCGNDSAALLEAVRRGLVTEAELDRRLAALLRTNRGRRRLCRRHLGPARRRGDASRLRGVRGRRPGGDGVASDPAAAARETARDREADRVREPFGQRDRDAMGGREPRCDPAGLLPRPGGRHGGGRRVAEGALSVAVDVTNTGRRDGQEVVQLYATPPATSEPREQRALCGFARVHLKAGETRTVTLTVPPTALRRWSAEKNAYVIPFGRWEIGAGGSSSDIRESTRIDLPER